MVTRYRKKSVEKGEAQKYYRVARSLHKTAGDLNTLAEEEGTYGNAIGIIVIHSAIAYSDALCIAYGRFKSTSGDHLQATHALRDALGKRIEERQAKNFARILREKDSISYQGVYYALEDARLLLSKLDDFSSWAERVFTERPTR